MPIEPVATVPSAAQWHQGSGPFPCCRISCGRQSERTFRPIRLLAINYGFDRIRFPGPVLVGSRVRLQLKLVDVTPRDNGRYMIRTESTVEVEDRDKPALVADWKFLLVFRD